MLLFFWKKFAGLGSKPVPPPSEAVEELKTQPNPQEEATGDSNWFSSIFGFNKKGSAVQQGIVWFLCQSHQLVHVLDIPFF